MRGQSARHLARVARLRLGEVVEVSDQSRAYRAVTESCSPDQVRFRVEEPLPEGTRSPRITAAVAIVRFARFEWAVEKLTELGVDSIVPLVTQRSEAKLVLSAPKRLVRWRRIAFEAAQQARRMAVPTVDSPTPFEQAVKNRSLAPHFLAEPAGRPVSEVYRGGAAMFLVGPEGGWTERELALAHQCGCTLACLGRTVLRTETAAVATAAICLSRNSEEAAI